MGTINTKQLVTQTEEILRLMKKGGPERHTASKQRLFLGQDAHVTLTQGATTVHLESEHSLDSVYIEEEAVDLFNEAVANIYADDEIQSLSAIGAVEKRYQTLIHNLFFVSPDERKTKAALEQLVEELRKSRRDWHVLVPIVNLHIKGLDEVQIGGVTLRPGGDWIGEYYSDLLNILSKSKHTKSQIGLHQVQMGPAVDALLREGHAVAIVDVECDASLIADAASARVDAVLDLLRCYGTYLFAPERRSLIGRIGELAQAMEGMLAFDQARHGFNLLFVAIGYSMPYELTREFLDDANRALALTELSQILAKLPGERTELEEQLRVAISLGGDAAMARTPEHQLVHFCAALEALVVLKREYSDKKVLFSERLAWLLGSDLDSRKRILTRGVEVYTERNNVIHKGKIGISTELVRHAAGLLTGTLAKLAPRATEWRTRDDFVAWVEQKKLEGEDSE